MKRNTEQRLADELDALITAKLHKQPLPPVEHVPESEVQFASALVDLATATQLDPDFTINLAAQLERAAHQSNRKRQSAPQRPSLWTQLWTQLWEQLTNSLRSNAMKKSIFALGAVAIVILAGVFFWNRFTPTTEPAVTDSGPTTTTDGGTAVANLPILPAIKVDPNAVMGGFGGGGGDGTMMETAASEADTAMPMPTDMWPGYTDIFSGTQFSLNVSLPTEPTTAPVQQHNYQNLTAEQAQQIATSFGFTGPVYLQVVPVYENEVEPGVEAVIYEPPPSYHVFDGQRELIMQQNSFYYMDSTLQGQYDYQAEVANAPAIAEAFLQEKGLLTFPYVVEQGYMSGEVNFFRLIDGAVSSMADYYVQVAPSGEIAFASANQYNQQIDTLGDYPLITPAEAWDLIVSGVMTNNIPFNLMPDFSDDPGFVEPDPGTMPRYWSYQAQPGEEQRFYGSVTAYVPADGNGRPRIDFMGYTLEASDADLQAMTEHPYEMMLIVGTLTDEKTITVSSWELMARDVQPIFVEGTIGRSGRDIIVNGIDGQTYILPNPPEDLPVDLDVFVFGWQSRDIGADYLALDWQNIDERLFYPEEPTMPVEEPMDLGMIYNPYVFKSVDIDQIGLAYYYMPQFTDEMPRGVYTTPPGLQLPVWKFSGQTDNGDNIEFYVQAVDPAYLDTGN